jgi:DNA invertase Pin-like site-specific DNA recombinase
MTIFGYARVSTGSQDYQSQVDKLRSAGATKTYREKISGARSDRPELRRLIKSLQAGDVMMVTAIDRAARNTRDLLNILDEVTKAGAKFKSLSEPWCDSTSPTGELMITVLAGVATFERHLILIQVRTSEGRARAVANGVKLGPKKKLSPAQEQAARDLRLAGRSLSDIAEVLRVISTTVKRVINGRRRGR